MRLVACLAVLVAVAVTPAASADESEPPPLGTVPLTAPTGLRLLIPDLSPARFDVDAERLTRVGGIDLKRARAVSTARVGRDAVLLVEKPHGGVLSQDIYVLRREATKAVRVASGAQLAPAQGGNAFWLKTYRSRNRCVLRRLTLAGRE